MQIQDVTSIEGHLDQLADLLVQVTDDGASLGFLSPLDRSAARAYWENGLEPGVILLIAKRDGEIAGTVQLHLCMKQNGRHRAEICKLMTSPSFRRQGIARSLMENILERARDEGRSLVVLDTREGDPSNLLYASLGFAEAGRIPHYAESANGRFDATIIYYKNVAAEETTP